MAVFRGVHVDIGGPLRVSDIEMHAAEDRAVKDVYGHGLDFLKPAESWQLYGIFSENGYVGLVTAALAVKRSGRSYKEFMDDDDPVGLLEDAVASFVPPSEQQKIKEAAGRARDNYMANQSRRLADGAVDGLKMLKGDGIKLSIITSIVTPDAIRWVKENGLSRYFPEELIMGNSPEGAAGRDEKADNLIAASRKMGLGPQETIYVADAKGDMTASLKAGCSIAMIREGMTPPELFPRYLEEMPQFEEGENYFEVDDLFHAACLVRDINMASESGS
jgi:phosphoglycolate phosphatase-like HAD superfamily hydrolase